MQTTYAGIDYAGNTTANRDTATGIRYGVISQHSLMPEAFDEIWLEAEDLTHKAAVQEAKDKLRHAISDYVRNDRLEETVENLWAEVEQQFNDAFADCGDRDWRYESGGYELSNCLSTDIFVSKSPYFTHAQYCSPCVPGAGNLDSPCETGPKTYCLGHDWFDGGKAPYPVFSVASGELVQP